MVTGVEIYLKINPRCHTPIPISTRLADPNRVRGMRPYTGTSYLLYQTLVCPSLITNINISYTKLQNKTTTVVVFTVSYTYSSESHLHMQNYTLHLHDQSAEPTVMNPYSVLAQQNAEDHCLLLLYLHGLKNSC